MIGIGGLLKIGLMAREAIRRRAGKLTVDMALLAHHGLMRTGEHESRAIMVERRGLPCRGCVTRQTVVREVSRDVVGISHLLKIILMA